MQSTLRQESYSSPTATDVARSAPKPTQVKLIYRGNTFYRSLRPVVAKSVATGETVTLNCRGNTYQRQIPDPQPYRRPVAINWRWQTTVG
jgi:hypothetical protein